MKLVKEVLSLELYGTKCELRFPTLREIENMEKENVKGEELNAMRSFLIGLGLPESIYDELQANHVTQIMEKLAGK